MQHVIKWVLVSLLLLTHILASNAQKKHKILLSESIFFESGSSKVQDKYKFPLQQAVDLLKSNAQASLWLHAHTDSVGTEKDNELLSYQRALAVEGILSQSGIDTSLLDIKSYGEYSPLADDGSEKGRAENRRVMIYVVIPFNEADFYPQATLKGKIVDAQTQMPVSAMIVLSYLGGKDTIFSNEKGEYEQIFNKITNVEARVYAKNYFFVSKVGVLKDKEVYFLNFGLEKASIGGKMLFHDLYFEGGTAQLLPSSAAAIESILTFMRLNDDFRVEIGGHINRPNSPAVEESSSSFQLSLNRARAVYDYLIKNGIAAERLTFKGYGNWQMIHPNAKTLLEEQINRRVELKIIE